MKPVRFLGDSLQCVRDFALQKKTQRTSQRDIEMAEARFPEMMKDRWTQTEAAQRCGITQPRMNDLLRGRVSRFSLDALVNIATAIGRRVHVELEPA